MGPTSLHLQGKKNNLLEFLNTEKDAKVRAWIKQYVDRIEKDIERAKTEEEREW